MAKKEHWYGIENFEWSIDTQTLVADEWKLWDYDCHKPFVNGRQQFFVKNKRTGNFRRFRLKNETNDFYLYESEDNILCQVNKTKDLMTMVKKLLDC